VSTPKPAGFLPAPASDYDGWSLDPRPEVTCPDCDTVSDREFEESGELLAWIDKHIPVCPGPPQ
jgi:hypothetical protein